MRILSSTHGAAEPEFLLRRVDRYQSLLRTYYLRQYRLKYPVLDREDAAILIFFRPLKLLLASPAMLPSLLLFAPNLILSRSVSDKNQEWLQRALPSNWKAGASSQRGNPKGSSMCARFVLTLFGFLNHLGLSKQVMRNLTFLRPHPHTSPADFNLPSNSLF